MVVLVEPLSSLLALETMIWAVTLPWLPVPPLLMVKQAVDYWFHLAMRLSVVVLISCLARVLQGELVPFVLLPVPENSLVVPLHCQEASEKVPPRVEVWISMLEVVALAKEAQLRFSVVGAM